MEGNADSICRPNGRHQISFETKTRDYWPMRQMSKPLSLAEFMVIQLKR
jgi:hypothetical protein